MNPLHRLFMAGHLAIIALFFLCTLALMALAGVELWTGLFAGPLELRARFDSVLESIGMLTIALVALELAQTIFE